MQNDVLKAKCFQPISISEFVFTDLLSTEMVMVTNHNEMCTF